MAYFINSPVNYVVRHAKIDRATFHRVLATVSIGGKTYRQSLPVTREVEGGSVEFDFSSSLRAFAESIPVDVITDGTKDYPQYDFTVKFVDEYMSGGKLYQKIIAQTFTAKAILGGWTEREMMQLDIQDNPNQAEYASLSLRPQNESFICPDGVTFVHHIVKNLENGLVIRSCRMAYGNSGQNVYIDTSGAKYYHFQFINTRGINESVFAACLASENVKGGSTTHIKNLRQKFGLMSHRVDHSDASYPVLSFSSGFVSLPMARWWSYEFCRSRRRWIFYDGVWMPCTVQIKDGNKLIDRTKTELLSVEFDVIPGINGSPCL